MGDRKNVSTTTRCLTNWTVRDAAGHTYRFGTFCLGGGKYVYLHTVRGTNTASHRYWGSGNYIWNNTGDRAYLRKQRRDAHGLVLVGIERFLHVLLT